MTVGRGCCEDRSISFDFGLPGAGVADETDDTDSSVTAEAARDSRLSGLLSSALRRWLKREVLLPLWSTPVSLLLDKCCS